LNLTVTEGGAGFSKGYSRPESSSVEAVVLRFIPRFKLHTACGHVACAVEFDSNLQVEVLKQSGIEEDK
jgi:hypothetical protein